MLIQIDDGGLRDEIMGALSGDALGPIRPSRHYDNNQLIRKRSSCGASQPAQQERKVYGALRQKRCNPAVKSVENVMLRLVGCYRADSGVWPRLFITQQTRT